MLDSGDHGQGASKRPRTRDRISRATAVVRPIVPTAMIGAAAALIAAVIFQGGGRGTSGLTGPHAGGHAPAFAGAAAGLSTTAPGPAAAAVATGTKAGTSTGPRVRSYPDGPGRFHLTVENARACALPPGVTGPAAGDRVRLTVTTGTAADGAQGLRVTDGEPAPTEPAGPAGPADTVIYYAGTDDIVAGFSLAGPGGVARAGDLTGAGNAAVHVECRASDGSWSRVASTVPLPERPAPALSPPVEVTDPLTSDSQVVLRRRPAGPGGTTPVAGTAVEATVDGRPATLAEGGERVLLPSGTGPGLHVLTLRFRSSGAGSPGAGSPGAETPAEESLTVPIINGYASPSVGGGAPAADGGHGGADGHRTVASAVDAASGSSGAGGGPTAVTGPIVLGVLSLLLIVTAGGLILIFHRRGTAA